MKNGSIRVMTRIALMSALLCICAWVTIPGAVPFTLQTLGVFLALGLLGPRDGALAILVYLLLGAVGLPVFSGFKGGVGVLLGATGGYLVGFLVSAVPYGLVTRLPGNRLLVTGVGFLAVLLVSYVFGTAWFLLVYTRTAGPVTLGAVLGWCVWPFLLPDAAKLALALLLTDRLRKVLPEIK